MSEKTERQIVSFWDLSPEWQKEAIKNNDIDYEDIKYFEPLDGQTPDEDVLWDLSECMRTDNPDMDGYIGISNNSAMAVKLSDDCESAVTWFLY